MDDPVLARLLDAALPFVAGRRMHAINLPAEALSALRPWGNEQGAECTIVLAQSSERIQHAIEQADGLLVLLLPGLRAPELPGLEIIDVQHAFEDETGVADARANATLPPDVNWTCPKVSGSVYLDNERPAKPLGCIVIAKVSK
jgi:hypothetical protein